VVQTKQDRRRSSVLIAAIVCTIILTIVVAVGATFLGLSRDGWDFGIAAGFGLATSLIAGMWLQANRIGEIILAMVVAVAVLIVLMMMATRFRGVAPRGKIALPTGSRAVDQFIKVAGTYEHTPPEKYLWVCVGTRYDPNNQSYCAAVTAYENGTWENEDDRGVQVGTGTPEKEVYPYEISLVLAERPLRNGAEGFPSNPPGTVLDRRTVSRRR
jgi:hypothetical protein